MVEKKIRLWDIIEVETRKPTDDPRPESRKIRNGSVTIVNRVQNRKERRKIINKLSETSLENALSEKRSLTLIEPKIENFRIEKGEQEPLQFTLEGRPFRKRPYADVKLFYKWNCPVPCRYCKGKSHTSRCFDWGANLLYRKYKDEEEARIKVRNKLHFEMKYDNDTWFVLGTTRRRPWKRWMVVGLLWMKKEKLLEPSTKSLSEFT